MKSRLSASLVAIPFLLVLFAPAITGLVGLRPRAIENRELAERPDLSLSELARPETFVAFSNFLRDHLPLRDYAVQLHALVTLHVFRDSPSPDVHLGEGEWLFFDSSFRLPCAEDYRPSEIVDVLRGFGQTVRDSGRQLAFTIAPDKRTLHPEELGSARRLAECSTARGQELREALAVDPIPGYVDLFRSLRSLKETAEPPLYHPNDSHWGPRAAVRFVEEIVQAVQPDVWSDADLVAEGRRQHVGDLTRLMGLPRAYGMPFYAIQREGVRSTVVGPGSDEPRSLLRFTASSSQPGALIERKAFVLHDSFLVPKWLAPYFRRSTFLTWVDATTPGVLAEQIDEADLVIAQLVERGVHRWVSVVLKDPRRKVELEAALSAPH